MTAGAGAPSRSNPRRVLVVGGTGMLQSATAALAYRCDVLCVTGRSSERLSRVRELTTGAACRIEALNVDYTEQASFGQALVECRDRHGVFDLAVCWIHSHAQPALRAVIDIMSARSRLVHVVGSASADPAVAGYWSVDAGALASRGIEYARVVLGFVIEPHGSRWLNDEEICTGTLRAIERPEGAGESVVGVVRPWSARP